MTHPPHQIPRWSLALVAFLILTFLYQISSSLFNVSDWHETDLNFFENSMDALAQKRIRPYQGPTPTLVTFWEISCEPCKPNLKYLGQFKNKMKIVGVHIGSSISPEEQRAAKLWWTKNVEPQASLYFDDSGILEQSFEIRGVPTNFLIFPLEKKIFGLTGPLKNANPSLKEQINYFKP